MHRVSESLQNRRKLEKCSKNSRGLIAVRLFNLALLEIVLFLRHRPRLQIFFPILTFTITIGGRGLTGIYINFYAISAVYSLIFFFLGNGLEYLSAEALALPSPLSSYPARRRSYLSLFVSFFSNRFRVQEPTVLERLTFSSASQYVLHNCKSSRQVLDAILSPFSIWPLARLSTK